MSGIPGMKVRNDTASQLSVIPETDSVQLRTTYGAFLHRLWDAKQILVPRNPMKHVCTDLIQLIIAFRDTKVWLVSLVKTGRLERR